MSQGRQVRLILFMVFIGALAINAYLTYIAFGIPSDSKPERLEQLKTDIEQNNIEVSKERFLHSLSGFRKYVDASDRLVNTFQSMILLLALSNMVLFLCILVFGWRVSLKVAIANKSFQPTANASAE